MKRELHADERVEVHAPGDDIATEGPRLAFMGVERVAEFVVDFPGEKRDLALVVCLVIEKAVAPQSAPSDAFNLGHRDHGVLGGGLAVLAEVGVAARQVDVFD